MLHQRPPLENGYYETFNRDDVTLVDVRKSPIQEITPNGIRTADAEYDVDSIVYATGFDAMTGTLFKLGIRGRNGLGLREKWAEGPRTYLGIATHGFPNLFMITGPQSPSVLRNMPGVYRAARGLDHRLPALPAGDGVRHDRAVPGGRGRLGRPPQRGHQTTRLPMANSWWVGANIPGKPRNLYPYIGGAGPYRQICDAVAARDYDGFGQGSGGSAATGEFTGVARAKYTDIEAAAEAAS